MSSLRFIDSNLRNKIDVIATKYSICSKARTIVYEAVDMIIAYMQHLQYADESLDELFKLLYAIKASSPDKKISIRGTASDDVILLDPSCNKKIAIDLNSKYARNFLTKSLEESVSNEVKDYYLNRCIVDEYESLEEKKLNEKAIKLDRRYISNKITHKEYKEESIRLYNSITFPQDYRYTNFFTIQNLHKIVRYNQKFENTSKLYKGQFIGKMSLKLLSMLSEQIFGVEYKYERRLGSNKILDAKTKEVVAYCKPEIIMIRTNEELSSKWSIYSRYILVFDLLFAIGLIVARKDIEDEADIYSNNEKYRAIKDSIKAYKDIDDISKYR